MNEYIKKRNVYPETDILVDMDARRTRRPMPFGVARLGVPFCDGSPST
jgi:hypothetical protein